MFRKKDTSPYPKPMVEQKNNYYALLLLEDYAGAGGELTAINQYMYQFITLQHEAHDIAELAKRIAIEEMQHFALLGSTIQLLGCNPKVRCIHNNASDFWSARFIYYGNDVIDKLTADIEGEVKAIRNYQLHKKAIDDQFIKVLLERIICDEEEHLHMFQQARKMLSCTYY